MPNHGGNLTLHLWSTIDQSRADQRLSDRRGADYPWRGGIGALP